ncbi:MAG: DUF1732 domain-containing protein [Candidatus Omnitrophica bacterium]|nr:DUF1732 domain-containing protein [Candidatus Omnitrophota bacterium]
MIRGMTGFGTSSFSYKGKRYVVNIRSVNHKFLDFVINLPDGLFSLEAKIKKELSKCLNRGRITFQLLSFEPYGNEPVLNKQLLSKYFNLIKNISRSLKIKQDIGLRDIIDLPEVIYFKRSDEYSDRKFLSLFNRALHKSLGDLSSLRKKEGEAICLDLLRRTQKINQKLKLIKRRLISIIEGQKTRLSNEELKDFLKNYNIEEEIVRLDFHVKIFKKTIIQKGPLGKILDFITQEIQREINTLSAKFRDSKVSYDSVIIKDEIEKIREQLQNVE